MYDCLYLQYRFVETEPKQRWWGAGGSRVAEKRALPRSARPRGAPVGYDLELDAIVEYAFLLLYSHLLINVVVKYMKYNNNNNAAL